MVFDVRDLLPKHLNFVLTGSQYFGNATHQSDWDFAIQWYPTINQDLIKAGFTYGKLLIDNDNYQEDGNFLEVYNKTIQKPPKYSFMGGEIYKIQIIVVRDVDKLQRMDSFIKERDPFFYKEIKQKIGKEGLSRVMRLLYDSMNGTKTTNEFYKNRINFYNEQTRS